MPKVYSSKCRSTDQNSCLQYEITAAYLSLTPGNIIQSSSIHIVTTGLKTIYCGMLYLIDQWKECEGHYSNAYGAFFS